MSHRMTILFTLVGCFAVVAACRQGDSSSPGDTPNKTKSAKSANAAKTQATKRESRGIQAKKSPETSRRELRILLTKNIITEIDNGLLFYAADKVGELPEGKGTKILEALTKKNDLNEDRIFDDPWIVNHKDAWGRPMLYEWPTTKWPNAKKPAVWSRGPNGIDEGGMGDDIRNWK